MKPVKGIDLKEVLEETSEELLKERRTLVARKIRNLLEQSVEKGKQIKKLTKDLDKLKKSKVKIDEMIKKVQDGDWSVLKDKEDK